MSAPVKAPRRNWKKWLRFGHSYLSLFSLLVFLFFGATGFALNHEEWFGLDQAKEWEEEGELPLKLCKGPDKLAIVELLRRDYEAKGPLHEFQVEDIELVVMFKRPGRSTDVTINREDGSLRVQYSTTGLLAMLTEFHTGEHSLGAGRLLIDAVSLLLLLASLSGFILWLTVPAQRKGGLITLLLGALGFGALIALTIL